MTFVYSISKSKKVTLLIQKLPKNNLKCQHLQSPRLWYVQNEEEIYTHGPVHPQEIFKI